MCADKEFFACLKKGEENKAISMIYRETFPRIRKYILLNKGTEEEVEDIFQDALLVLYHKMQTGELREEFGVGSYLVTICRNMYINYVNRHIRRSIRKEVREMKEEGADALKNLIQLEKEILLDKALQETGCTCNKLLRMSVYDRLSMKEIAEKMGYASEDVAKSRHYSCKKILAEMVRKDKSLYSLFRYDPD